MCGCVNLRYGIRCSTSAGFVKQWGHYRNPIWLNILSHSFVWGFFTEQWSLADTITMVLLTTTHLLLGFMACLDDSFGEYICHTQISAVLKCVDTRYCHNDRCSRSLNFTEVSFSTSRTLRESGTTGSRGHRERDTHYKNQSTGATPVNLDFTVGFCKFERCLIIFTSNDQIILIG